MTAAVRRTHEELGVAICPEPVGTFSYWAQDSGTGLVEHELDHVPVAPFSGSVVPDPAEVADWLWVRPEPLVADVARRPHRYTPWLALVLARPGVLDAAPRKRVSRAPTG